MKNEEYEMSYKYGYKLGKYKSSCDISVNFFKMTFGKKFAHERKRIKWLSNYELELLWNEMFEYLRHDNSKYDERKEEELNKYKANILKLLR